MLLYVAPSHITKSLKGGYRKFIIRCFVQEPPNYPKNDAFWRNPMDSYQLHGLVFFIVCHFLTTIQCMVLNGIQWNSYFWLAGFGTHSHGPLHRFRAHFSVFDMQIPTSQSIPIAPQQGNMWGFLIELVPSVPSESTLSELLFGSLFLWNFFDFLLQKGSKSHRQNLPLLEWPPWAPHWPPNATYLNHPPELQIDSDLVQCPFLVNVHHHLQSELLTPDFGEQPIHQMKLSWIHWCQANTIYLIPPPTLNFWTPCLSLLSSPETQHGRLRRLRNEMQDSLCNDFPT